FKDQVVSPAGSTIAGVASLEVHAFRVTVMHEIHKAYKQSQKLGQ
ncbi:pyrroline-5-carboxylate reductase, partial [Streptococcus pneumoniae]